MFTEDKREFRKKLLKTHYDLSNGEIQYGILRHDVAKAMDVKDPDSLINEIMYLETKGFLKSSSNVQDRITHEGVDEVESDFPILSGIQNNNVPIFNLQGSIGQFNTASGNQQIINAGITEDSLPNDPRSLLFRWIQGHWLYIFIYALFAIVGLVISLNSIFPKQLNSVSNEKQVLDSQENTANVTYVREGEAASLSGGAILLVYSGNSELDSVYRLVITLRDEEPQSFELKIGERITLRSKNGQSYYVDILRERGNMLDIAAGILN